MRYGIDHHDIYGMTNWSQFGWYFSHKTVYSEAVVAQSRQELGKGIAGWVAENGEPVLMSGEAKDDERFRDALAREEEILYCLSVPLTLRNKIMGVLNLGVTPDQSAEEFSEQELRIATIFAQHASVAIDNARLMKEMVGSWR